MTVKEWNTIVTEAKNFCPTAILEKFDKAFIKIKTESYDEGYKAGANHQNNDPCVCGFWGKKCSNE